MLVANLNPVGVEAKSVGDSTGTALIRATQAESQRNRHLDRRTLLQGALGGWLGASVAGLSGAAPGGESPGTVHLDERMAVLSGLKDNVVVLSTGKGSLLVDSGSPGHTETLMAMLRRLGAHARVRTLLNTHWHVDQTGSNAALGRAGARIIAQHKTWDWVSTDHYDPAERRNVKALPKTAWPTQTFFSSGSLTFEAERIDYGYLPEAHTDGDAYYFFRDANVLVVGHVVSPVKDPVLDWYGGGWLGGRIEALGRLFKLADDRTKIVPAYGPPVSRAAIKAEHDMMHVIYTRMVGLMLQGYSAQEILDAGVLNGLGRSWTDPKTFVFSAFKGLWGHQQALSPTIL